LLIADQTAAEHHVLHVWARAMSRSTVL